MRESLHRLGVDPSSHWLQDCQTALRLTQEHESVDAVVQQILYHDLRDVVRTFDENDHDASSFPAAVALRQYVQASLQEKVVVPATWGPLLLQIEETVDVSENVMTRLQHGPVAAHNPTAVGNQLRRCLKIAAVDGYYAQGQRRSSPHSVANVDAPVVTSGQVYCLMEVSPIPQLSVNSRAGLKMVLRGPLVIRRGLIMLHGSTTNNQAASNLTILGGQVERLVQMQRAALQQASRIAGVGMDPTIRALIGNNTTGIEDEDRHGKSISFPNSSHCQQLS
jgi:RecQ mediated genome instability protein